MGAPLIITKMVVVKMVSLLDWCYRLGVESASMADDEGLVREFLERTEEAGVYGFLTENPVYMDWQEWTLRLMSRARMSSWNGIMKHYLDRMQRFGANYLSVFLPLTQVFLNRGVRDYMENPAAADIAVFREKKSVWWTRKGLRKTNLAEWVSELRMLSYDMERRDTAIWESRTATQAKKVALTAKQHQMFRRSVGLAMMKGRD